MFSLQGILFLAFYFHSFNHFAESTSAEGTVCVEKGESVLVAVHNAAPELSKEEILESARTAFKVAVEERAVIMTAGSSGDEDEVYFSEIFFFSGQRKYYIGVEFTALQLIIYAFSEMKSRF